MSLPIAILSSIAFIKSTEASPFYKRATEAKTTYKATVKATIVKAAAEEISFKNNPSQTALKSSTAKMTTTTTKAAATTSNTVSSSSVNTTPTTVIAATPTTSTTTTVPPLIVSTPSTLATTSSLATPSSSLSLSNSSTTSGVSGGAIGGIIAAVVIIVAGIAAYFIIRKKKQSKKSRNLMSEKPDPFTMGFGSDQAFSQPQQPYQHQYGVPVQQPEQQPQQQPQQQLTYNNYNTSFHDANNHIITSESMMPPTTTTPAPQYQPQLPQAQQFELSVSAVALPLVSENKLMPPTQAGSVGVFYVAATYTPTLSDEIDIQTGDQVEVLVEYDDGWCQGINLSRGNAKGVFPKHCIDYAVAGGGSGGGNNEVDNRGKRTSSMYITGMPPH